MRSFMRQPYISDLTLYRILLAYFLESTSFCSMVKGSTEYVTYALLLPFETFLMVLASKFFAP